jgi:hypothetical protein
MTIYSRTIKANNQNHIIFSDEQHATSYKTIQEAKKRQAFRKSIGAEFAGGWMVKVCETWTEYQTYFEGEPTQ